MFTLTIDSEAPIPYIKLESTEPDGPFLLHITKTSVTMDGKQIHPAVGGLVGNLTDFYVQGLQEVLDRYMGDERCM